MKWAKAFLAAAVLWLAALSAAQAQSGCSIFVQGKIPTPGQWNQCLQSKQDVLGYTPLNTAGGAMSGRLATAPSSAFRAGFAIAPGVAPSSPVDGDMWITSLGLYAQINGATVGPYSSAGSTIPSVVQGDILYGSAPGTLVALPKNTSPTRYLSNTGTNNNPAWAQVSLANGVSGNLPLANLATGTQDRLIGYFTSTSASSVAINNCSGALTYSTSSHAFGCNASGSVVASGTPTAGQIASWVNATTIQGISAASLLLPGGGISISGSSPATIALANNGAIVNLSVPGSPAAAGGAKQLGIGGTCTITPSYSTRVSITVSGNVTSNTSGQGGTLGGTYGTGTAPIVNTAQTGTNWVANPVSFIAQVANQTQIFSRTGVATGLSPGQAIWFDLTTTPTANTVIVSNVSCYAFEF